MKNVRADVYGAIEGNDLSAVVFTDPLSSVTRQYKRNVLAASFVALLIATLQLEITGFLGLQATNANLGNLLAQGLACLIVLYFLVTFVFHLFVDYSAWQFKQERQLTQPYLELIRLLESQVNVTGEQINNACSSLRGIVVENDMPSQVEAKKRIDSALSQLNQINERIASLVEESKPLIASWETTIRGMNRLDARLRMRFLSLWAMDILLPLSIALLATWSTRNGVSAVIEKIAS